MVVVNIAMDNYFQANTDSELNSRRATTRKRNKLGCENLHTPGCWSPYPWTVAMIADLVLNNQFRTVQDAEYLTSWQ